jgi:hypothetical protein
MPKDCPKCGLLSPPEAERCDCGYDFVASQMKRPYLLSGPLPKAAGIGVAGAVLIYLAIRMLSLTLGK